MILREIHLPKNYKVADFHAQLHWREVDEFQIINPREREVRRGDWVRMKSRAMASREAKIFYEQATCDWNETSTRWVIVKPHHPMATQVVDEYIAGYLDGYFRKCSRNLDKQFLDQEKYNAGYVDGEGDFELSLSPSGTT